MAPSQFWARACGVRARMLYSTFLVQGPCLISGCFTCLVGRYPVLAVSLQLLVQRTHILTHAYVPGARFCFVVLYPAAFGSSRRQVAGVLSPLRCWLRWRSASQGRCEHGVPCPIFRRQPRSASCNAVLVSLHVLGFSRLQYVSFFFACSILVVSCVLGRRGRMSVVLQMLIIVQCPVCRGKGALCSLRDQCAR